MGSKKHKKHKRERHEGEEQTKNGDTPPRLTLVDRDSALRIPLFAILAPIPRDSSPLRESLESILLELFTFSRFLLVLLGPSIVERNTVPRRYLVSNGRTGLIVRYNGVL